MTDQLKFLLACVLVAFHFCVFDPVTREALPLLYDYAFLATDGFLLLSGFSLARAYQGRALEPWRFLLARVRRVYPAHLMVMAAWGVAGLALAFTPRAIAWFGPPRWGDFWTQVMLVNAWGISNAGWNGPTWTISALLPCWLLFPITRRATARAGLPGAVALAVVCVPALHVPYAAGVLRALPLFALGVSVAQLTRGGTSRAPACAAASFGVYLTHWAGLQLWRVIWPHLLPDTLQGHLTAWALGTMLVVTGGVVFGLLVLSRVRPVRSAPRCTSPAAPCDPAAITA